MKRPGFTVIPAIDLKGGRCVRLWQGDMGKETVYSENPEEVAILWEEAGARLIHVVDLDGAVSGRVANRPVVERIVKSVGVPIEIGGGIRDRDTIADYFSLGVGRVILGTAACANPENLEKLVRGSSGEVYIGIDARDGLVAVDGWRRTLSLTAADMAKAAENAGAAGIIYTDISRDGTLAGPNFEALCALLGRTPLPVIASGGISTLEDLAQLAAMASLGCTGAILGRALYAGKIDLHEALRFDTPPTEGT